MASLTHWTWVWASSGRWWRTGKSDVLRSIGSQSVGHDWATEQHFSMKVKVLVTQSRLTLCGPMDYSPPGSSVHGILQARILEWVAFPSPGESSQPRDQTQVSCIAGRFFTVWTTREFHTYMYLCILFNHEKEGPSDTNYCVRWTLRTLCSVK